MHHNHPIPLLARIAAAAQSTEGGADEGGFVKLDIEGSSDATEQGSAGLLGERAFHDRVRMRQAWEALGVEPQLVAMLCQAGVPAPKFGEGVPRTLEELAHEELPNGNRFFFLRYLSDRNPSISPFFYAISPSWIFRSKKRSKASLIITTLFLLF